MLTRNQKIFNELKESAKRIPVGCVVKYPDIYENIESYKRVNVNCVSTTLNFKLNGAREGELKDEVVRLAREIQKIYNYNNKNITKYWCYEYCPISCDISEVMNEIDKWREVKKEIYNNPLWDDTEYCPMDGEKLISDDSWKFGYRNYCPKCTYDYCIAGG